MINVLASLQGNYSRGKSCKSHLNLLQFVRTRTKPSGDPRERMWNETKRFGKSSRIPARSIGNTLDCKSIQKTNKQNISPFDQRGHYEGSLDDIPERMEKVAAIHRVSFFNNPFFLTLFRSALERVGAAFHCRCMGPFVPPFLHRCLKWWINQKWNMTK